MYIHFVLGFNVHYAYVCYIFTFVFVQCNWVWLTWNSAKEIKSLLLQMMKFLFYPSSLFCELLKAAAFFHIHVSSIRVYIIILMVRIAINLIMTGTTLEHQGGMAPQLLTGVNDIDLHSFQVTKLWHRLCHSVLNQLDDVWDSTETCMITVPHSEICLHVY